MGVGAAAQAGGREIVEGFNMFWEERGKAIAGRPVEVIVEVAELIPERLRARLACTCKVGDEIVLDGEAWVKVPSAAAGGRPLPRI